MDRGLYRGIWQELSRGKAMVFLAGPRQSGKTTLARLIAGGFANSVYFNWDISSNKKLLIENPAFFQDVNLKDATAPLVILDEIHKYRRWKNYLKGVYDGFGDRYRFLVLGSGRLNVFQKGGDSLAGRYFLFSLWPFTLAELGGRRRSFKDFVNDPLVPVDGERRLEILWRKLSALSGFPEPFLSAKETHYRRWSTGYHQQIVREDIRNMMAVREIDAIETLFAVLPSRVGSPLSMASLSRDLQVSFNSIRNWLYVFDAFFLTLRLSPWEKRITRAITKEKKVYLYDYASIADPAAKFENMTAIELSRAVSNWNDLGLGSFDLHYIRNKEKEEVDFLVTSNREPKLLIESKLSDDHASKSLLKFQSVLNVPAVQLVNKPGVHKLLSNGKQRLLIISATRWLASLP